MTELIIKAWKRFIDHNFCIWKPEHGTTEHLLNILKILDSALQFSINAIYNHLSLPDVPVRISNGSLVSTDIDI